MRKFRDQPLGLFYYTKIQAQIRKGVIGISDKQSIAIEASPANKDVFMSIFKKHITRSGSEELFEWLETSSDFFEAPASTRFHAVYEGGLLEHSINVYRNLDMLVGAFGMKEQYSDETIAIVGLLHDICKANYYQQDTKNVKRNGVWVPEPYYTVKDSYPVGHSEKSVIMLQEFIRLSRDEIFAIRAHMGAFDSSFKGGDSSVTKIFEECPLALLTHFADMVSTYINE